jgi:ATP adenylyltransferase
MERIWAPWRMEYITGSAPKPQGCVFCLFPAANDDAANLILARNEMAFIILNRYPYNNGHLMVVPRAHVASPDELNLEQQHELQRLLYATIALMRAEMKPDGFNLGMNIGKVSGAGIAEHCHYHIVPRWNGDTNFMPVLNETRVISEHLEATYRRLRPLFTPLCAQH